ncbi:chemotaxis protein histidine kinase CheA [Pseudarthrobacter sp. W1I19]|uniref:excalibur calcium-binding domain-containing protein n=1 Tax=Pseudarthrobacter sp. W1I19 TaxID=3042288 RepID=UPI0027879047|nr:excalibur calcium-binding domain-containing protein [Pseudarthrobacter sp. W1I19]MDQ0924666.1 chemotaxis protein histidine kinase CheA [Pseudarthrobacter sp. W1I19]
MKKTLTLVVLTGLMLTGCGGGKQVAVQATETATAVAAVAETVAVPGVIGMTLDKATEQLEDLGFKVEALDTVDGKSIIVKKNWQVISQDPTESATAAKGSTVHLGVTSLEKLAAEKAAAEKAAAEKAAAEQAVAAKAAAEKAAADKAAADKAAADKAAADVAAAQAAKPAPAPAAPAPAAPAPAVPAPAVPAPAAVYYANCTAARQAGAAPVYAGTPGYGKHLDRDGDGIGCDK